MKSIYRVSGEACCSPSRDRAPRWFLNSDILLYQLINHHPQAHPGLPQPTVSRGSHFHGSGRRVSLLSATSRGRFNRDCRQEVVPTQGNVDVMPASRSSRPSLALSRLVVPHVVWWLSSKGSACWCRGHTGCRFDPWSGRSPGAGNGNPLQYSCLEKSMDRGAWRAAVHRVTKTRPWLAVDTCPCSLWVELIQLVLKWKS